MASVLTLLDERPMHGYDLITELDTRSEGRWRPSPGTMYPALKRMVAKGFVSAEEVDGKRVFSLTDEGRAVLGDLPSQNDPDAPAPWDQQDTGGRGDLRGSIAELAGQARQIGRFGTPEQIEQARAILSDAKAQIYRVLANQDQADADHARDEES